MRLFRVGNKGPNSSWVFADDEQEAGDIYFRNSSTRKRENIRICHECNFSDFPKTDIEQVNVKGVACVAINGGVQNFNDLIRQIQGEQLPEATQTWVVSDNGQVVKG